MDVRVGVIMKARNLLLAVLALLALLSGTSAWAHGARVGVSIGVPVWGPVWYPPPVYYPAPPVYYPSPPVVVVRPEPPPVYIEQHQPEQQYWYYCASAKAYYPYVKECREAWQRVLPQPEK